MGAEKRTGPVSSEEWLPLAVRYLARWDRTVAQVEQFLRHKGASPAQARRAIGRLSDLRYLDDRAYAERWIEHRQARHPMGRERLRAELLAKGIADALVEETIHKAFRVGDEERMARHLLQSRQQRGCRLTPVQAQRLLRQRGFEEDTIDRIMGTLMKREDARA
ncbi:MAG TPA: regulatory protein RecX [Nitrospira sp.]|nr:regulatory protein RecX [Nitrospira sp.]